MGNAGGQHCPLSIIFIKGGAVGMRNGIFLNGRVTSRIKGTQVSNNKIENATVSGIHMVYTDSAFITENDISRPLATTGIYIGVDLLDGNIGARIERNRLHQTHGIYFNQPIIFGF